MKPGGKWLLWCQAALLIGISSFVSLSNAQDRLRVGVWNIEKLSSTASRGFPELMGSDSFPPRSNSDLKKMAEYIRDTLQVDALMITEIEADSPLSTTQRPQSKQLNKVAAEMGESWKYFLGRTGDKLRLGLLFNTERVKLKKLVNLDAPHFPVSGKDVLDRDPFIVWISAKDGNAIKNDVMLICVHLKSRQKLFRNNRMAAIAKLIGDYKNSDVRETLTLPSPNEEPEVLIVGDCNDSEFNNSGFKYLFDYLDGVGFQHIRNASGDYPQTRVNGSQIDHIFGTKKILNDLMIGGSFKVHTVPGQHFETERIKYRKALSDHFPVTIDLKIRQDNDFTINEAMATEDPNLRRQRMAPLQQDAFERAARLMAARAADVDDEDDGELQVNFEVRDRDFEEILAPSATSSENAELDSSARRAGAATMFAGNSGVPVDRFAKSELPIKFFEQNWTPAESVEFYSLRQGSPLMRRDFFDVLEQPDGSDLFRDSKYLASFGFLPQRAHAGNTQGYPIGFTGDTAIEINCAACHTSKLTYNGKEYWVDGSQAMTDLESWLHELVRAIKLTVDDAPDLSQFQNNQRIELDQSKKFGRFVRRLTGTVTPTVAQAQTIYELLKQDLDRRQRYNDYNQFGRTFSSDSERSSATRVEPYGFSRMDALGAILNQACAEHLDAPGNARASNAPVNYPMIWDAPQHVHVQWNGSVDNTSRFGPLGRNTGQVIGVFGLMETEDSLLRYYDTSVNFDALKRAEELVTKLWSPQWPEEFGLDEVKASQGESVYRANCIQCHQIIDRDHPGRRAREVLVPINRQFGGSILGTDHQVAKNWKDRTAQVGRLAGRTITLPFSGSFPGNPSATAPAREILTHMVFRSIAASFVPWRGELTIEDEHPRPMTFAEAAANDDLMRYKARPLNGVWTTAPYLHNGSVLDMVEMLKVPEQRKSKFRVGTTRFDPTTLGYADSGPFEFDTTKPGNSKLGHAYGTQLSEEEKQQLIEFIKTL